MIKQGFLKLAPHKRGITMHPTHDTGTFTTVSGMVGGVVKAISAKPVLMTISFGTLSNVMFYAAASATVGYFVKLGLDRLASKFKSKDNNQNSPKVDE